MAKFKILFLRLKWQVRQKKKVKMAGKFCTRYLTNIDHSHIPLHPKFQFFSVHSPKFWSRHEQNIHFFSLVLTPYLKFPSSLYEMWFFFIWYYCHENFWTIDLIHHNFFFLIWYMKIFLFWLSYWFILCPLLCNEIL